MRNTLVGFCHIEKAAGTSLIHLLRDSLKYAYGDVRPVFTNRHGFFDTSDLRFYRRLNPRIRVVGGHSVVPHAGIGKLPDVQFITVVREPVARCMSLFRFWVDRMGMSISHEEFLRHRNARNFQVRKIAGTEDVAAAKQIIQSRFALAGVVECYDEFAEQLTTSLGARGSPVAATARNVAPQGRVSALASALEQRLREQNLLDLELWTWLRSQWTARPPIAKEERVPQNPPSGPIGVLCERLYRSAYLKGLSGIARVIHGLPWGGSYVWE